VRDAIARLSSQDEFMDAEVRPKQGSHRGEATLLRLIAGDE
jgi:hypothetical protein